MSRILSSLLVLAGLLPLGPLAAQAAEGASIRFEASRQDVVWVGERLDLYLELWTDDVSFSGQSFVQPQVSGGYLLPAESGTVKLNEKRGGVAWQGLRYTMSLYPQRAGEIGIPAFDVRFSTSSGYGSEPREHAFRTPELTVTSRFPPGADTEGLLVTSRDFRMDAEWEPSLPAEAGAFEMLTGDALVLTVRREASGVPGMVFAPLSNIEIDGLGVYVDAPTVRDRANRGALTGTRSDRITVVCEKAGRYRLPEFRFQWWDPVREELREEVIPAVQIEVSENPAWARESAGRESSTFRINWNYLWFVVVAWLLWWPGRLVWRTALSWLQTQLAARRLPPLNPCSSEKRNDKKPEQYG
ncbi:MAG: hypothetical protein V2I48_02390 [Xanthomonadales bacterium]|jgi:hypothetical protein|nr:hypothetical protein [Xanthomonadales bacterium]